MSGVSKKILVGFLTVTLILSSMTFLSFAESTSTNLSATSSATSVDVGDTFTVAVAFKGGKITTFTGGVSFDKSIVQYVSYIGNDEDDTTKVYFEKASGGKAPYVEAEAKFNEETESTFGINMPGTSETEFKSTNLVTLTFKALKKGDANIKLYEDSDGTDGYKGENIAPGFTVTVKNPLSKIEVTTPPTKTTYCEGQTFDKTAMVVTATYADKTTKAVTSDCTFSPTTSTALKTSDSKVTVSYTEDGVTKTAEQSITVNKHDYQVKTNGWHWATNYATATVDLKCKNCTHEETGKSATVSSEVTSPATCEAAGETTFTATLNYNNQTFTDEQVDNTQPAAKNHDWSAAPSWSWTDYTSATATFTCKNDSTHKEYKTATGTDITVDHTTPAECGKAGLDTYTAKVTFNSQQYTTTKTKTVPALEHDYTGVKPTWNWNSDCTKATASFKCKNCTHTESVDATGTAITCVHTTPVQCETDGTDTYTATVTFGGSNFSDSTTKTVAHEGHKYSAASQVQWSWDGTTKATAVVKCLNCTHTETAVATGTAITNEQTEDPGCVTTGTRTYTAKVKVGGVTFTNSDKTEDIAPTGHNYQPTWNWNWTSVSSATATFDGECTKCHDKQSSVTATVSDYTPVKDADCTNAGQTKAKATVKIGDQTYTDWNTTSLYPVALDHDFSGVEPEWDWNNARTQAKATFKCKRNGCTHSEVVTVTATETASGKIVEVKTKEPKCESKGLYTYTATVSFKGNTFTDTQTKDIAALDHDYTGAEVTWTWTNYSAAVAKLKCQRQGCTHEETGNATISSNVTKNAGCTVAGETTYTAKATVNKKEYTDTKVDNTTPAATGHDYKQTWNWNWTSASSATATFDAECTKCHDKQSSVTATVSDYTPVKDADCTNAGQTKAKATVKIGNDTYTDWNTTSLYPVALDHDFSGVTPTWDWNDARTQAKATFKCKRNGCTYSEVITVTATETTSGKIVEVKTTEPKCETKGLYTYTATVNFKGNTYTDTKTKDIAALDHDYTGAEATWTWTNYSAAVAKIKCQRQGCNHEETGNASISSDVTKPATCEQAGETTYTASVTIKGNKFTDTKVDKTKPEALQHSYKYTWDWSDDHESATLVVTCERDGCEFRQEVPATVSSKTTKEPSCTEPGETTYTATATFQQVEKKDTYVDKTKPAKLGHDMEAHPATDAKCEEDGNTAYWYCKTCKKYFSDEEGNTEIEKDSWVIPATGHLWQKESYNKQTGELKLVCVHDSSHKKTETYSPEEKKESEVVIGDIQAPTDDMKAAGIETTEDIINGLNKSVSSQPGFENADKRCVEAQLLVNVGTEANPVWVIADKDIFPKDGIKVKISWEKLEGMDKNGTFMIAHMYSETMTGADGKLHKAGDVEIIKDITKTDEGIEFTVYSLSPFEVAAVPAGGGGTTGGGTDTGDANDILPFALMLVIALGGAGLVYKRRDN